MQITANFEVTDLGHVLIVVGLFGPHARHMCKRKIHHIFLVSVVSSVSTGRAARAGEHLQNSANFEVTDLGQFLIVVELFGDHESGRFEVHFCRTNMLVILVSWVSTRTI